MDAAELAAALRLRADGLDGNLEDAATARLVAAEFRALADAIDQPAP